MENAHLGGGSPPPIRARPALRGGRANRPQRRHVQRPTMRGWHRPRCLSCRGRRPPSGRAWRARETNPLPLEASLRSLRNVGADDYGRPHDSGGIRPRMEDARADRARHARRPAMRGEHAKRIRTPLEARGKSAPKPVTDQVMIGGGQSLVSGGLIYSKFKFFSKNLR